MNRKFDYWNDFASSERRLAYLEARRPHTESSVMLRLIAETRAKVLKGYASGSLLNRKGASRAVSRGAVELNDYGTPVRPISVFRLNELLEHLDVMKREVEADTIDEPRTPPEERMSYIYARDARPFIEQATSLAHAHALALSVRSDETLDVEKLDDLRKEEGRGDRSTVRNRWKEDGYQPTSGPKEEKLAALKANVIAAVDEGRFPQKPDAG